MTSNEYPDGCPINGHTDDCIDRNIYMLGES
jgi:hypothetical protein